MGETIDEPSSPSPIPQPKGSTTALGDYVIFPARGVKIRQPEGFETDDSFDGFGMPGTHSSVMIVSIPTSYSKAAVGFTEEQMKKRGWSMQSKELVDLEGRNGILVHFEQPAQGRVFSKWSLIFGDDQKTTMVTATCPKSDAQHMSVTLKTAVLSTRVVESGPIEPGSDVPFTITGASKLKLTSGFNRALAFTKDGITPAKSPKDPILFAAPSIGMAAFGDKRKFAESRLGQISQTKLTSIKSTEAITIDGLEGYESFADAEDTKSATPLAVYQVILFDESSYFVISATVGAELRDEYLPEFKSLARSFKRKQP